MKLRLFNRRPRSNGKVVERKMFNATEVKGLLEETRKVAYADGRRDGIAVARQAAINSLKDIIWQQNNPSKREHR